MGDFSEHVLFGLLVAVFVAYGLKDLLVLGEVEVAISVLAVFLGSIIPDIDHKNSYVHRAVKSFLSVAAGLVTFLLPLPVPFRFAAAIAAFLGVYLLLSRLEIRHRGITHTLSFAVTAMSLATIAGIFVVATPIPGIALGVGLLSHLMLDQEFKI